MCARPCDDVGKQGVVLIEPLFQEISAADWPLLWGRDGLLERPNRQGGLAEFAEGGQRCTRVRDTVAESD